MQWIKSRCGNKVYHIGSGLTPMMIVVPISELKKFNKAGAKFAKSVGDDGKDLLLSPDEYATLQTYRRKSPPESIGKEEVKIKSCGLSKRFEPEALQMFHADALDNGTAGENPFTVRRVTWDAAQKYRCK